MTAVEQMLAASLADDGLLTNVIKILLQNRSSFVSNGDFNSRAIDAVTNRLFGSLRFRDTASVDYQSLARTITGTLFSTLNGGTFWDGLIALADQFKFILTCDGLNTYMVPSLRGLSADATSLPSGNLTVVGHRASANPPVGAIVVRGGPETPVASYDTAFTQPVFSVAKINNVGAIRTLRAPSWIMPSRRKLNPEVLKYYGRGVDGIDLRTIPFPVDVTDSAARWGLAVVYDQLYHDNVTTLGLPLGTDIVAGEVVKFNFGGLVAGTFVGFVESVRLTYDAKGHSTGRELTVTHVHSEGEEGAVPIEHPLFSDPGPEALGLQIGSNN
jgi:hypothetical protein